MESLGVDAKTKEIEEEVDDVKIQSNRSTNILVVVEFLDELVRVVDDVSAEQDCSYTAQYHRRKLPQWMEYLQDSLLNVSQELNTKI